MNETTALHILETIATAYTRDLQLPLPLLSFEHLWWEGVEVKSPQFHHLRCVPALEFFCVCLAVEV